MFYTSPHAYFQTQPHPCIGRHQAMEMRSFWAGFIPQNGDSTWELYCILMTYYSNIDKCHGIIFGWIMMTRLSRRHRNDGW
jgi:hypothetical protein